jgi:hypothetical protein
MTYPPTNTASIVDGCARVIADIISGHVFAAGITVSVTAAAPEVVPLADDFTEAGMPAVTCAMGAWDPILQPGNERLHMTIVGAVWRPRVPLGDNTAALYADRDAIADAWIAHTKAYLVEASLQSAILMGGPGIVSRSIPSGQAERTFLTLPFTVQIVCNRIVIPQAA